MTTQEQEDKLAREADKYANNIITNPHLREGSKTYKALRNGYLAGIRSRQAEIEALTKERDQLRGQINLHYGGGFTEADITALARQNTIDRLTEALDEIANPFKYMQLRAEKEGASINGMMAMQIEKDPEYLKSIARKALEVPK